MMTDQISEIVHVGLILVAALVVYINHERWASWRSKCWDNEMSVLEIVILICMVTLPIIDATQAWVEFADVPYYSNAGWFGFFCGVCAVWLFFRAVKDYQMPHIPLEQLEHKGIYRYIRHPFYTALLVLAVAQLLLSQNWLAGLAGLITFALVYSLRVPRDEEKGLEEHGHHYLDYMSRTGELLPRFVSNRSDS
jgi:protein-S-isoprenylcysteine O-methyltransferase Ste14